MSKLNILFPAIAAIVVLSGSCKSLQPIEENPNNNTVEQEARSLEDVPQPIEFSRITPDERVFTGTLSNGLTYYIMPNKKPENRAELRLVVKAGSIDEDYDQLGLAHFIEHMAFNGTEHFSKNELIDYLESVGTKFGPDLNAYTSFDETVYMLQVRTDEDEQLKKGLLVLSDWANGLSFDSEEIDKERGVVISEWRTRLSASQRMQQEYLPTLLKGSRYAKRLPIGDPEIIKNASDKTIKRFYYEWYRPDLMAVVAVGDFTPALIEEYLSEYFAGIPKAIGPREKEKYGIPPHSGTLVEVCTDPEAPITQVRIINKLEGRKIDDVGDFRERMISRLFTQMINARLSELTQSLDAPFLYASTYQGPDIGPMDSYSCFAACKEGRVGEAIELLVRENERVKKHGFTEAEFERAKAVLLKAADNVLAEKGKIESGQLARKYIQHFLKGTSFYSPEAYHQLVYKYVPKLPISIVNRKSAWFTDSNRVVIVTAPESEKESLPGKDEILEIFDRVKNETIEEYKEDVSDAPLLNIKLSSPKVVERSVDETLKVEEVKLENGATVLFKTTDFNNDEILFRALSRGGQEIIRDDDFVGASHSAWIIRESGVGEFSNIELEKKLAGKKVSVRPFLNGKSHGLTGNSGVQESELLGQLIYLFFTDIRKDSLSFVSFKERMMSYYSNLLSDPSYYFSNEVSRIVSNENFRMMFPSEEDLSGITMEQVYEVFETLLDDPSDYHFIFTGNLNEEVKNQLLSYIGAISSGKVEKAEKQEGSFVPESNTYTWEKGQAPKTYVEVRYYHKVDSLTREVKDDLSFVKSVLDIRLREELREDKGGVYGVRSLLSTHLLPNNTYMLGYGFTADPEMAGELIDASIKVIEQMAANGPDPDDLTKVREIQKRKYEKDIKTNDFWINSLGEVIVEALPMERLTYENLNERLERMDAQRVQKLIQDIVDQAHQVTFIQNPE